jgi:hypothetical protein
MGLHEWSKNDTIISLYVTKFGTKGLYLKTEKDIAKHIGTTEGSLKMQCANIRSLTGQKNGTLSDFSQLQSEVFNEYNGMNQYQLMKEVKSIINQDDYERCEALKRMGRDPRKMTKI